MINIIDYGSGNLRSVSKAFDHLGFPNRISADPRDLENCQRAVLPGVGAFGACVQGVRQRGFEKPIREFLATGKPFLGICVGMQILVETSEESPEAPGLGIIKGSSPKFAGGLKTPQIGWNRVERDGHAPRLLAGVPDGAYCYFVHSYSVRPSGADAEGIAATAEYGERFPAVYERGNLMATQFHPEKSQRWGLQLLKNFASL